MKARLLISASRTILLLSMMFLSACGGNEVGKTLALPATSMTVGVPITDTVVLNGFNAYTVPVIPGGLYKMSITGLTDDADLLFFGTDSTFTFLSSCAVDNTRLIGLSSEDCIINAPGNALYFEVDGTFLSTSSATFNIDVELLSPPVNLILSLPSSDMTTQTSAAAYVVPVTPGVAYTISITGLTDDADLFIFGDDVTFSSPATCSIDNTRFIGTTPEDCTLTSTGGMLYFIVDGIFSTAQSVTYTTLVTPAPSISNAVNEGSITTPVIVSVGTASSGQVGPAGISYYVASNLTPNTRYTVSITGLTNDADLKAYTDNTFTNPVTCLPNRNNTGFAGTTPEDCSIFISGGSLYFSVSAGSGNLKGAGFINLVNLGP
ncbi:MAG TPA: hypothetical protein VL087_09510 [Nitrospirota bacterium]|nr:hypothetical protein [Nitrospirota bacterium]